MQAIALHSVTPGFGAPLRLRGKRRATRARALISLRVDPAGRGPVAPIVSFADSQSLCAAQGAGSASPAGAESAARARYVRGRATLRAWRASGDEQVA